MKIAVIGAGVIGVTTAYVLMKRGAQVTVFDRQASAACETSFANGTLLTPSMSDPWNSPGIGWYLLKSLFNQNSAVKLRVSALPSIWAWGLKFLRNSSEERFRRNTLSNLRLGLRSMQVFRDIVNVQHLDFFRTQVGTLKVFRNDADFYRACADIDVLRQYGLVAKVLSAPEAGSLEPGLLPIQSLLAGALHFPFDESGDARAFTMQLADRARCDGVQFNYSTSVENIVASSGKVLGLKTSIGLQTADAYVIAAGSYSAQLCRELHLPVPVYPAKGYSVTLTTKDGIAPIAIPLVDDGLHVGVVPFQDGIRVVGTAEFSGFDARVREERIDNLLNVLTEILPDVAFNKTAARSWSGFRPMSADGVPMIGRLQFQNLWLNTGHGHLGWTQACGAAELLADLIGGSTPQCDPAPFMPVRFA